MSFVWNFLKCACSSKNADIISFSVNQNQIVLINEKLLTSELLCKEIGFKGSISKLKSALTKLGWKEEALNTLTHDALKVRGAYKMLKMMVKNDDFEEFKKDCKTDPLSLALFWESKRTASYSTIQYIQAQKEYMVSVFSYWHFISKATTTPINSEIDSESTDKENKHEERKSKQQKPENKQNNKKNKQKFEKEDEEEEEEEEEFFESSDENEEESTEEEIIEEKEQQPQQQPSKSKRKRIISKYLDGYSTTNSEFEEKRNIENQESDEEGPILKRRRGRPKKMNNSSDLEKKDNPQTPKSNPPQSTPEHQHDGSTSAEWPKNQSNKKHKIVSSNTSSKAPTPNEITIRQEESLTSTEMKEQEKEQENKNEKQKEKEKENENEKKQEKETQNEESLTSNKEKQNQNQNQGTINSTIPSQQATSKEIPIVAQTQIIQNPMMVPTPVVQTPNSRSIVIPKTMTSKSIPSMQKKITTIDDSEIRVDICKRMNRAQLHWTPITQTDNKLQVHIGGQKTNKTSSQLRVQFTYPKEFEFERAIVKIVGLENIIRNLNSIPLPCEDEENAAYCIFEFTRTFSSQFKGFVAKVVLGSKKYYSLPIRLSHGSQMPDEFEIVMDSDEDDGLEFGKTIRTQQTKPRDIVENSQQKQSNTSNTKKRKSIEESSNKPAESSKNAKIGEGMNKNNEDPANEVVVLEEVDFDQVQRLCQMDEKLLKKEISNLLRDASFHVLVARMEKLYDQANQESMELNEKLAQLELVNHP